MLRLLYLECSLQQDLVPLSDSQSCMAAYANDVVIHSIDAQRSAVAEDPSLLHTEMR